MSYAVEGLPKKAMQKGSKGIKRVCYVERAGVSEVLHVLSVRARSDRTALQVSRYVANMLKQHVALNFWDCHGFE